MSQFTLTYEEDLLVLGAVRAKAAQYLSSMGVNDPALDALMDKIQSQFTPVETPVAPVLSVAPVLPVAPALMAVAAVAAVATVAKETPLEEDSTEQE